MSGLRLSSDLLTDLISALRRQRGGEELLGEWRRHGIDLERPESLEGWVRVPEGHEGCCVALVSELRIEALWVDPSHRRRGHGSALLAYVLSLGAPRDGVALPGDRDTKSLYEKAGFKARLLTMTDGVPATDD